MYDIDFSWLPVALVFAAIGIGLRINTGDVSPAYVERPFPPSLGYGETRRSLGVGGQGRGQAPRQLQFATPGGTRIIWTFHEGFSL